jgi:hypothetical protein
MVSKHLVASQQQWQGGSQEEVAQLLLLVQAVRLAAEVEAQMRLSEHDT